MKTRAALENGKTDKQAYQEAKEQANAFMQQFGGALLPTKV
ncbi:hypothetical protein [Alysiella crassa]|nr:hypothetical protein [Alysiella crassa]